MKHVIENGFLKVEAVEKGAELNSIWNKKHQLEYLWSGDPAYWSKKSPVLFPVVGALKNNEYQFEGNTYQLGRHGFAREKLFRLTKQEAELMEFTLTDDADTLQHYPFPFAFRVTYQIKYDDLLVSYDVENTGQKETYFSLSSHPAIKLPLVSGTTYNDYYLELSQQEPSSW